jgi:hypothetical protein
MHAQSRSLLYAFVLVVIAGCGGPSFEEQVYTCATPSGALSSADHQLPQLIRAVEQQRGLPLQLSGTVATSGEINTAKALAAIYDPALHLKLTPTVTKLLEPAATAKEREDFLRLHKELVERTADAADLPRCVFEVGHEAGFFASMFYLDDAALAARLLVVRSLHAAENKDRSAALADMLRALRISHALAKERRVEARALAASLRYEALGVATEFFYAGVWRRHEAEQLYGALREALSDWPADSRMLIGERATVIHAYEALRAGMLQRIVTLEERQRLRGRIEALEKATPAELDADEARYLRAMQRLIAASEEPYPNRSAEIAAAMAEINSAPTLFAATLFAKDLPAAIETAALDRATVEAWTLALATAAELIPPPIRVSPRTGKPLEVEQNAERVEIYDGQDMLVGLPLLLK